MTAHKTVEQLYQGTHDLWQARVGDQLGSLTFKVSEEIVERNAWANDDYNPWYLEGSPYGGRIISPVFLSSFDVKLFYGYYAYPAGGSLFAKQEFEYVRPLMVGETYTISGVLADVYQRRGRTFFQVLMKVCDLNGAEVMRVTKTIAAPVRPTSAT